MTQNSPQDAFTGPLGVDTAKVFAKAESLCRTVAGPDLAGCPLYLVPQSRLAPHMGGADCCNGYTCPSLDLYLQEAIGPAWCGRGPCIVINDLVLATDSHPDDLEYVILGTAIHELAHILQRPTLYADRLGVDPMQLVFETLVVAEVTTSAPSFDLPPYWGHEAPFIRLVLHLSHRARLAGIPLGVGLLCAGYRYGLSPAASYQTALGSEPQRSLGMPFSDILASRPPPAFEALWKEDVDRYQTRLARFRKRSQINLKSFFDRVRGVQTQRVERTIAGYRDLVTSIANGDEPEPGDVDRHLAAADKSLEDLRHDVECVQRRRELKAKVAATQDLESTRRELQAQIQEADRVLEAADQHHTEVTEPLHARLRQVVADLSEANSAARELVRSCDDPELRQAVVQIEAESQQLFEKHRAACERATFMEQKAHAERERASRELTSAEQDARREVATRYQRDADLARREIKQMEKAQLDLARRREQVEQQMRSA